MAIPPPPLRPGSGFEADGPLDLGPPSESLAGRADAVTFDGALAGLDDDELIGVARAWRRLESWCSAGLLTAIGELARRRPAERSVPAAPGEWPVQLSEFISDEIAAALTMSSRTATTHFDLAVDLAIRLPRTMQALRTGAIDFLRARIIADATRVLADDQARAVEARIFPAAEQQNSGQLRAAVARAVQAVDPEAATRRRLEAQKDPRVRRWQEDAGTAALGGFGLPPADVLEADQRITAQALALRDAGLPGSLEELRARAYLDTLLGQRSVPPQPTTAPDPASPSQPVPAANQASPPQLAPATDPVSPPRRFDPATPGPRVSAAGAGSASANQRCLAARINLTASLTTLLGLDNQPADVAGFGPVDPELARELAALAAAHPASRYCVTITGDDGRAIGHGCVRGRTGPPDPARAPDPASPPDPSVQPGQALRSFTVRIEPLASEPCEHRHQEPGYQPSRRLQHLVTARTPTCTAPGCRWPAARCDIDHTVPYDQGGRTCECGLAPLCRHHHRCKQSEGWHLDQPAPGVMAWTTPAGRRYLTQPADLALRR
jgi:Domain of unknown function (DUF222)